MVPVPRPVLLHPSTYIRDTSRLEGTVATIDATYNNSNASLLFYIISVFYISFYIRCHFIFHILLLICLYPSDPSLASCASYTVCSSSPFATNQSPRTSLRSSQGDIARHFEPPPPSPTIYTPIRKIYNRMRTPGVSASSITVVSTIFPFSRELSLLGPSYRRYV